MQCPSCSAPTTVIAISEGDSGSPVRRRRQCCVCAQQFTTIETVSRAAIIRNGVTEPFSRHIVIAGVRTAAQRSVYVLNALARQGRSRRRPGSLLAGNLPESLKTDPSPSGGWSPFSLASASGRG
ncbi:hypothetical protein [Streptomyces cacaoi]|uniref:NrdR family transcriptional regulator n=1 Tax=Streptomyces cacaoi TaxID=1898 RepID=UPI00374A6C4F